MKFQTIANKIENISEFEMLWFFLETLDPRVRTELESKNVKTIEEAILQARVFTKGMVNPNKPTFVNYSRHREMKRYSNDNRPLKYKDKPQVNSEERGKPPFCYNCKKPVILILNVERMVISEITQIETQIGSQEGLIGLMTSKL